jgi:hypothetical protein
MHEYQRFESEYLSHVPLFREVYTYIALHIKSDAGKAARVDVRIFAISIAQASQQIEQLHARSGKRRGRHQTEMKRVVVGRP